MRVTALGEARLRDTAQKTVRQRRDKYAKAYKPHDHLPENCPCGSEPTKRKME